MTDALESELLPEGRARTWRLLLLAVILVAAAIRIYSAAAWPIRGDEPFTVRDSLRVFEQGRLSKYPSYYVITAVLFKLTGSRSAYLARIPSLLIALATFPLFWHYGRRAFGRHVALIAVAAIAVTEWHAYHSAQARFYTGVFLLAGLSALLLYTAVWERRPWRALAALILGVAAATFHPSGGMVVVGGVCYFIVLWLFPRLRPAHPIGKVAAFYLIPVAVGAVPGSILAAGYIRGRIERGLLWSYSPIHMMLGIMRQSGYVVCLAAFAGALVCAFRRSRWAVFLLCWLLPGVAGLIVVALVADVRPDYTFGVAPAIFFLAAALCVVPFEGRGSGAHTNLCVAALAVIVVASQFPPMVSYFTEKRFDNPDVPLAYFDEHARPSDQVVNFMSGLNERNLGRATLHGEFPQFYSAVGSWDEPLAKIKAADARTWFIVSYPRVGMPWQLGDWLRTNAQLVRRWRAKRYDYLTRDIEIWLYDPKWPERPIARPPAAEPAADRTSAGDEG